MTKEDFDNLLIYYGPNARRVIEAHHYEGNTTVIKIRYRIITKEYRWTTQELFNLLASMKQI